MLQESAKIGANYIGFLKFNDLPAHNMRPTVFGLHLCSIFFFFFGSVLYDFLRVHKDVHSLGCQKTAALGCALTLTGLSTEH